MDSDNTSSDKLPDLLGGSKALTERMQSLGFSGIAVRAPTKAMGSSGELPNEGTPEALAGLLASLERGELLEAPQRALLWDLMGRARTGERRIRAGLPPGTQVLDKTGAGGNGTATNDVGVVTLPGSAGHLAIAVLIAASSLPPRAQEDLIAEIARTAFDSFYWFALISSHSSRSGGDHSLRRCSTSSGTSAELAQNLKGSPRAPSATLPAHRLGFGVAAADL